MQDSGRPAVLALILFLCFGISASAAVPANPLELVRQTVQNELKSSGDVNYIYEMSNDHPGARAVFVRAELADGVLTRLLSHDGKPETPEEYQQWEQGIRSELMNRESLREDAERLRAQNRKTMELIRLLPTAFLYEYGGNAGPNRVRLKFWPNPKFRPPSREARIFQGAGGIAIMDTADMRVVSIDATIFRNVDFAWGLFGRLDRGGRIVMEFGKASDGSWNQTALRLHVSGRVLFRRFRQDVEMRLWNHQRLPSGTTLEQAFEKLKSYPVPR